MSHVAVLLADGFEEIEAVTVIDVLRRADIKVRTLALKHLLVKGAHGIPLQADGLLEDEQGLDWDLVVLPGGQPGADTLRDDPRVGSLLERQLAHNKSVAAICAAPIALGAHGMLKGRRVACYPGFEDQLLGAMVSSEAVIIDEHLTTGRGPAASMLFALELVKQFKGEAEAEAVHRGMMGVT